MNRDLFGNRIVFVNASIHNLGDGNATNFTARLFVDDVPVENKTVSVNAFSSEKISFTLLNFSGPHKLTVFLDPENRIYEQNESNNNASKHTCGKGDFNCDGAVDHQDYIEFEEAYKAGCSDSQYNVIGDFNNDCIIDLIDFVEFSRRYEE